MNTTVNFVVVCFCKFYCGHRCGFLLWSSLRIPVVSVTTIFAVGTTVKFVVVTLQNCVCGYIVYVYVDVDIVVIESGLMISSIVVVCWEYDHRITMSGV